MPDADELDGVWLVSILMLSPVVARALNVPAPGVDAPMLVPSMFPALMSTVGSVAVPVVLSVRERARTGGVSPNRVCRQ